MRARAYRSCVSNAHAHNDLGYCQVVNVVLSVANPERCCIINAAIAPRARLAEAMIRG